MSVSIVSDGEVRMMDGDDDGIGFVRWAKAYGVRPLNSVKRTCELLGCGHDHLYGLVKTKKLTILKDGSRSNITGEEIYKLVRGLPTADEVSRPTPGRRRDQLVVAAAADFSAD